MEGVAGAVAGNYIANLNDVRLSTTNVPSNLPWGPSFKANAAVERTVVKAIKGAAKVGIGPVAVGSYFYDVSQDISNYEGEQRGKAIRITSYGTAVTVVGAAVAGFTLPVWAAVGGGVILGIGVSYGVDYIKQREFGY